MPSHNVGLEFVYESPGCAVCPGIHAGCSMSNIDVRDGLLLSQLSIDLNEIPSLLPPNPCITVSRPPVSWVLPLSFG